MKHELDSSILRRAPTINELLGYYTYTNGNTNAHLYPAYARSPLAYPSCRCRTFS